MRILGVDPGEKNIGLAISDPTGTIANPLTVVKHKSHPIDATTISQIAAENQVERIVIGQALDQENKPTFSGRRAARLGAAIRLLTQTPVVFWDESYSTQAAREARKKLGLSMQKRSGHLDDLAATVILQSYLDSNQNPAERF